MKDKIEKNFRQNLQNFSELTKLFLGFYERPSPLPIFLLGIQELKKKRNEKNKGKQFVFVFFDCASALSRELLFNPVNPV